MVRLKINLRVMMAMHCVNIQDLADRTGLSRSTISALYNETGKGIHFDTLLTLCTFFRVSPGDLITMEDKP